MKTARSCRRPARLRVAGLRREERSGQAQRPGHAPRTSTIPPSRPIRWADRRRDESLSLQGRRAVRRRRAAGPCWRKRSARLSIAIPPPPWSGTTRCSPSALPAGIAGRLFGQGQRQSGGAEDPGAGWAPAPMWCRAANWPRRWRPAFRPARSCFPASARPREEMRSRAGSRHLPVQCRKRAGTGGAERGGAARWASARPITLRVNPDVDAKTHAKITTGTAETKFGIPLRRAREAYAHGREAEGHRDRRRRCPYRQPDHRTGAVRGRLQPGGRTGRASCAPMATPSPASIWAAGWACLTRTAICRRPIRRPMARWSTRVTKGLGCSLSLEPGRLIAANAGRAGVARASMSSMARPSTS